jgi:hypothetical protein
VISEAEVFVLADRAAVQVYGQIREDQWETQLPPLFDMPGGSADPTETGHQPYAYDNAWVPDMLAGRTIEEVGRDHLDGDLLGDNPRGNLERHIGVDDGISEELAPRHVGWNGAFCGDVAINRDLPYARPSLR